MFLFFLKKKKKEGGQMDNIDYCHLRTEVIVESVKLIINKTIQLLKMKKTDKKDSVRKKRTLQLHEG